MPDGESAWTAEGIRDEDTVTRDQGQVLPDVRKERNTSVFTMPFYTTPG